MARRSGRDPVQSPRPTMGQIAFGASESALEPRIKGEARYDFPKCLRSGLNWQSGSRYGRLRKTPAGARFGGIAFASSRALG